MMVSLRLSDVEDRREKRKEEIFALCAIQPLRAFFASSKEASSLANRRKERHHLTRERTNERTNEIKSPRRNTFETTHIFQLIDGIERGSPTGRRPRTTEPPLEEDEDEGRPDDALEEEGLPNSLLNMMNM